MHLTIILKSSGLRQNIVVKNLVWEGIFYQSIKITDSQFVASIEPIIAHSAVACPYIFAKILHYKVVIQ